MVHLLSLVSLVPTAMMQEPMISLDIMGERLENAAPKIAHSLGLESVVVNPQIKDQVVLISVKNVPQKEFIDQLDQVLNIEVSKKTDGWWLTQSPAQKIREEKAEKAARDGVLKEMIAELKKIIASQPPLDANETKKIVKERQSAQQQMMQAGQNNQRPNEQALNTLRQSGSKSPQSRFGYRVAARIRPEHLNALNDSLTRIVFSTKPTSMQKPFPFSVSDLLNQLMVEQQVWIENGGASGGGMPGGRMMGGGAGGAGGAPGGRGPGGGRGVNQGANRGGNQGGGNAFEELYASADPVQGAGPGRGGRGGGIFEIPFPAQGPQGGGRGGPGGGGMFGQFGGNTPYTAASLDTVTMTVELRPVPLISIRVYSNDDMSTLQTQITLDSLQSVSGNTAFTAFTPPAESKISSDLKEFPSRYQRASSTNNLGAPPSEKLLNSLLTAESSDPLSLSAAPQIKSVAGNRNVMMVLDDALFSGQAYALDNPLTFFAKKPSLNSDLKVSENWLTRSWINPLEMRPQQVDRTKLGTLLRFLNKNKRTLTLEEEATFVAQLPWEYDTWRKYGLTANVAGLTTNPSLFQSTPAFRIYGNLSESDRNTAKSAAGIDIVKLSGGAQKELYRAIFLTEANQFRLESAGGMGQIFSAAGGAGANAQQNIQKAMEQMRRMFTGKMTEPTFALPTGLQPGMLLKLSENSSVTLSTPPDPKANTGFRFGGMDARGFGMAVYAQKNAQTNQRGPFRMGEGIDPNRIIISNQRNVRLSLVVNKEGMFKSWNLQSASPQTSKIYTLETLPADVKKQVDEGMKMAGEMANRMQNMPIPNGGGGGRSRGNNPPPPSR